MNIRRFVFGNPLKTANLEGERLTKVKALAIFSSDVLSSVAYATEEILIVLTAAFAFKFSIPVAIVIGLLIIVVCGSYWQTIEAYPTGGGAFAVAHKNLGEYMGLIAAAALMIDYTLTVAVSLSAGVMAIVSAFPCMAPYTLKLCLVALAFIVWTNLRGTRESANVLAIPTYCFIFFIFLMIVMGTCSEFEGRDEMIAKVDDTASLLPVLIILRAFSSGCSALTGIEAISSGVTAFKTPQYKNAQITLAVMGGILFSMFLGITFLANKFHLLPCEGKTLLSQVAQCVFGDGILYYCVQLFTSFILLLAANTSFAGFPRLASVLAKERYIPSRFANLGDRLAFSNGIIALAAFSTFLLIKFNGDTHSLIPLYSLGVFISFTLSQVGMIRHWIRERGENWHIKSAINLLGAIATFVTLLTIVEGKFLSGAWMVAVLIPVLVYLFKRVNTQYKLTGTQLDPKSGGLAEFLRPIKQTQPKVVVPIAKLHKGTLSALRFAASLSNDVVAVIVNLDVKETEKLKLAWRAMKFSIPLVILDSPYRSVISPLFDFLDEIDKRDPEKGPAIVVLPSFVPGKLWQHLLHNQTATILKTSLLYRKSDTEKMRIIVDIPYQLKN